MDFRRSAGLRDDWDTRAQPTAALIGIGLKAFDKSFSPELCTHCSVTFLTQPLLRIVYVENFYRDSQTHDSAFLGERY